MSYLRFLGFSVAGATLWVVSLVSVGYLFGNMPIVKNNLTLAIFAIVILSVSPIAIQALRVRARRAP
jgi:membrane-associated protein